jgi:hypothetical protein
MATPTKNTVKQASSETIRPKTSPRVLLLKRTYAEVDRWPANTKSFLQEYGYDMRLDRNNSWFEFLNHARRGQASHSGWKLHISVGAKDMPRLWELCFPVILRYGLHCKFADIATAGSHDSQHRHSSSGKMLVIYSDERPALFFLRVAEEIENTLIKSGIKPGQSVPASSSKPMPGSKGYIFYRNDRDARGNYMESAGQGFNPLNKPDTFANGFNGTTLAAVRRDADFLKKQEAAAYPQAKP